MNDAHADVAVIGGGLIGCMIAYQLRRRGKTVIVIERGAVGGASSGVSFGSLRLQGQHGAGLALAVHAQAMWERTEAELGQSVGYARHGHVHLALNPAQQARLESNGAALRSLGIEPELLGRAEALRRWPFLGGQVLAASWSPRDAVANPRLVAPAFARAAQALGAGILEHTEVVSAGAVAAGFATVVRGGEGPVRTIRSDVLVNAAGAWASAVAGWFGDDIPSFAAGPSEIVTEPMAPFVQPVIHVVDGSVLFRQTRRGNVIIGGHPRLSVDQASHHNRVPPDKVATNLARLAAIAPHLRAYSVIRTWTGVEAYLPDMAPALGPSLTTAGLFHACAFSGHGLQLGPAAAAGLADLVAGGATEVPIAPFGLHRFGAGADAVPTMQEEFSASVLRRRP